MAITMTSQELKNALTEAEENPKKLAAAVSGLSAKALNYRPAPNKWNIHEIVAHLADSEIVFAYRFRQVLADTAPTFAPIDQDKWAATLGYLEAPVAELLAQYGLERHHNLRLLRRLKPEDLAKSGFHPERKKQVTLEEMIGYWSQHGTKHLEQIEERKRDAK
jgi:uncharacterized damage-inducible protein DinB